MILCHAKAVLTTAELVSACLIYQPKPILMYVHTTAAKQRPQGPSVERALMVCVPEGKKNTKHHIVLSAQNPAFVLLSTDRETHIGKYRKPPLPHSDEYSLKYSPSLSCPIFAVQPIFPF
jgi:hypothetical protein